MKPIAFLLLFLSFAIQLNGQSRKTSQKTIKTNCDQVKIDSKKPTVYIEFEKTSQRLSVSDSEPLEIVHLTLINNSKWSVYVPLFEYVGRPKLQGLYHDVELENPHSPVGETHPEGDKKPQGVILCAELKSGKSVHFSVPADHLSENLMIRVKFMYSWVWSSFNDDSADKYPEIQSSVYFTNSMLKQMKND